MVFKASVWLAIIIAGTVGLVLLVAIVVVAIVLMASRQRDDEG